ncbi:glycosyltransferase family 39 protein [Nannocystaceae bacterium ST9]
MSDPSRLARVPAWAWLFALVILHLALAWPGAGERGIIAEEIQPYLHHYPEVVDGDRPLDRPARAWPPHDDVDRELGPRWIGTGQWPVLAWQGRDRIWPVFVRGHQTALGSWWGIALAPLLGDGVAGVRRSSVLLGLVLVLLLAAIARRSGLDPPFVALAGLVCVLSPGLWFFTRTGYGFELASRVFMLAALAIAARPSPIDRGRGTLIGLCVAAAILSRATIAVTLGPALILLLVDPRRWPGFARFVWPGLLGVGLPIGLVGLALATLPFWSGTTPGADLPIAALAGRTLVAPACAFVQLAWVVDPRLILAPLVAGSLEVDLARGVIPALIGSLVLVAALVRWWRGRSRDGERMFVVALLANASFGAWLYGKPMQFQLAMALEPLFALALIEQLHAVWQARRRVGAWLIAAAILARASSLVSLAQAERATGNPMLSGQAQRAVVAAIEPLDPSRVLTTDYNHAGVLEAWTGERIHPIHGWPALASRGGDVDRLRAGFGSILDGFAICHVLFTVGDNLVGGEFSDPIAAGEGLELALAERGRSVIERRVFGSEAGTPAFELWSLSGCE